MSDKISYVLEVLDGYSKVTAKLKEELSEIKELTKFKFNSSDFKGLAQLSKEYDKIAKSAERIKKAKTGFTLVGGGSQITAISGAEIRRQKSLKNAVVPFSNPFVMMGGGSGGRSYNPRGYKPNFNIPIDSTYRRDAAGTGIVPYSRGGAVMSFGQRPMIDVTGTARAINQESTASWQSEQRYYPKEKKEYSRGSRFSNNNDSSGRDRGISLANVAKGMGYYRAIDMAVSVPSKIHDVTIEMDSLRAGLSALIPTVKGMQGATSESEVNYLRGVADKYGADFTTIAPAYLKLLGTGGSSDAPLIKGLLENVSGYAGIIGLQGPAFERTMLGFQDMLSKQVLNAQEVNLQMANLPGAKIMLHKAFKRFAEKRGMKGITDDNASAYFVKAMATGKVPSVDILREFVNVMHEMFGEDMIKKSFTLGREEKRLKNAFQELGDQIGLLTYDAQIGGVRSLTNLTKSVGEFAGEANRVSEYMKGLFSGILPEKGGVVEKTTSAIGGTAVDLYKMVIGSPFYAAKYGGALALAQGASIMGDNSLKEDFGSWAKEEFLKNNFEDLQAVYKTDFMLLINALKEDRTPQKIDITIKSDNNIQVKDVKSSRPSTVKAGQKWVY